MVTASCFVWLPPLLLMQMSYSFSSAQYILLNHQPPSRSRQWVHSASTHSVLSAVACECKVAKDAAAASRGHGPHVSQAVGVVDLGSGCRGHANRAIVGRGRAPVVGAGAVGRVGIRATGSSLVHHRGHDEVAGVGDPEAPDLADVLVGYLAVEDLVPHLEKDLASKQ